MIKRNKKIAKLLVTAMCTSLVANASITNNVAAFADSIEFTEKTDSDMNKNPDKELDENVTIAEDTEVKVSESDKEEINEENIGDDSDMDLSKDEIKPSEEEENTNVVEDESVPEEEEVSTYDDGSGLLWEYNDGNYTAVMDNMKIRLNLDDNHTVTITGYTSGEINSSIPAYLNMSGLIYKVRNIDDNAFTSCRKFKNVKIPGTVESIGSFALG